jgi:uncharacterized membrane protein YjfL (UPF0719 family)
MNPSDLVPRVATFVPAIINSVVFSVIGLVTFLVFFFIVDKLTPGELWKELVERKNTAVAIFFGCLALGMSLIIAACLHG